MKRLTIFLSALFFINCNSSNKRLSIQTQDLSNKAFVLWQNEFENVQWGLRPSPSIDSQLEIHPVLIRFESNGKGSVDYIAFRMHQNTLPKYEDFKEGLLLTHYKQRLKLSKRYLDQYFKSKQGRSWKDYNNFNIDFSSKNAKPSLEFSWQIQSNELELFSDSLSFHCLYDIEYSDNILDLTKSKTENEYCPLGNYERVSISDHFF